MRSCQFILMSLMLFLGISPLVCQADNDIPEYSVRLESLAKSGNPVAQYRLGLYYENEMEYDEAVKWFKKSADKGNASAQYKLGMCYYHGNGVEEDEKKYFKWIKKAAENGSADAQCEMGEIYTADNSEIGVKENPQESFRWYLKAAQLGNMNGQYEVALCYEDGYGVTQNDKLALNWFLKAAEQENAEAQLKSGYYYYNGKGVDINYSEAVKWYQRAVAQGERASMLELGICYLCGRGVTENFDEGVRLLKMAADRKVMRAFKILDEYGIDYYPTAAINYLKGKESSYQDPLVIGEIIIRTPNLTNFQVKREGKVLNIIYTYNANAGDFSLLTDAQKRQLTQMAINNYKTRITSSQQDFHEKNLATVNIIYVDYRGNKITATY